MHDSNFPADPRTLKLQGKAEPDFSWMDDKDDDTLENYMEIYGTVAASRRKEAEVFERRVVEAKARLTLRKLNRSVGHEYP